MSLQDDNSGQANINVKDDNNGYVFKKRCKKIKRNKKKKVITGILIGILAFLVVMLGTVFVLQMLGKNALLDYSDVDITAPDISDVQVSNNGKIVTYKGEKYQFNEDVTSILFLGVDKTELGAQEYGNGGQADVDILVAHNTKNGSTKAISISRDTMVDVNVYSAEGSFINTKNEQLCLAYAYGDGKELSCQNSIKSVSRIMYGLPINSYFALDLESIGPLNDSIGGVELVMKTDMKSPYGRQLKKGDTVTLIGNEAESYVRYRDTTQLESNNDRMERQIDYLKSFISQAVISTKQDINTPIKLYNTASPYMVTNLSVDKVTYLALNSITNGGGSVDFAAVPGTVKQGKKYAEFHPDETALYEMILNVYYNKIS